MSFLQHHCVSYSEAGSTEAALLLDGWSFDGCKKTALNPAKLG